MKNEEQGQKNKNEKVANTTENNDLNSNTKKLMQLLNHSVGAGLHLQLNYKLENRNK